MSALAVGSTIWLFDENRRRYAKPAEGSVYGQIIYREHWQKVEITGENRRSWITKLGNAPKRGPHPRWAFSEQEVDDDCWRTEHRYKIIRLIDRCDPDMLRKIAELVGYKP